MAHNERQCAEELIRNSSEISRNHGENSIDIEIHVGSSNITDAETKETSWHFNMVMSLIKSMEVHQDDLSNSRKRKEVFENICIDMLNQGFSVNADIIQRKWKSLVRSYKVSKHKKTLTGKASSRFHFFEEMDAILDNKPHNKCQLSIESREWAENEITDEGELDFEGNSSHLEQDSDICIDQKPSMSNSTPTYCIPSAEQYSSMPRTNKPDEVKSVKRKRSYKILKEENKMIRHAERMELERQKLKSVKRKRSYKILKEENKMIRHAERMELERQKLKVEEKKIKLMEKYLKQCSEGNINGNLMPFFR